MTSVSFYTYKVVQILQAKGYSKDQAEGMVDSFRHMDFSDIATKSDIKDVLIRIESAKSEMLRWVVPLVLRLYGIFVIKFFGMHS